MGHFNSVQKIKLREVNPIYAKGFLCCVKQAKNKYDDFIFILFLFSGVMGILCILSWPHTRLLDPTADSAEKR